MLIQSFSMCLLGTHHTRKAWTAFTLHIQRLIYLYASNMNAREKELIFDEIQNQVTEPLLSAEKLS